MQLLLATSAVTLTGGLERQWRFDR
jgi:hypothetical protein